MSRTEKSNNTLLKTARSHSIGANLENVDEKIAKIT